MPRVARLKTEETMFHIMIHSISERLLFVDSEDKDMFLHLLKKCKAKYPFKLYAFCLMDTHAHFIIDCFGSDISKIMHYTNLCYSMYYNKKYVRQGPLFHDRFKSKIINSFKYLANLSAYIHSNPKDLVSADTSILDYPYNSLVDYLYGSNRFSILDSEFLYNILGLNSNSNRTAYLRLINSQIDRATIKAIELPFLVTETKNEKTLHPRLVDPQIVISFISHKYQMPSSLLYIKYSRTYTDFRAACCFMLSTFSSMSQKQICKYIGNITQSNVSHLINRGFLLVKDTSIIEDFIKLNQYST